MEKVDRIGALLVKSARLCRVYKTKAEGKTFKKVNKSLNKFRSNRNILPRLDEVLRTIISELNRAKAQAPSVIMKGGLAGIIEFLTYVWNFELDTRQRFRKLGRFQIILQIMISDYFHDLVQ